MNNRRSFLTTLAGISLFTPAWSRNFHRAIAEAEHRSPETVAADEDFWYSIQQAFTVSPSLINLNNGLGALTGQSIADYKNLVRMRFAADGSLTRYCRAPR